MALNITTQPSFISPTGNPMIFRIEDTDISATFFRVTLKEVGTDKPLGISKVFKSPTEEGNFIDVSNRLKDHTSIEVDNSSMVYESVEGAVNYYVLFESIDNTGSVISSLTSSNKWAISGGGDILNGYNYDMTDWYMDINQIGVKYADFLTSKPLISKIFLFQKEMLYFLADENSGVIEARINLYRKDGTLLKAISEPIVIGSGLLEDNSGTTITDNNGDVFMLGAEDSSLLHRLFVQPNFLATTYDFDISELDRMEVALYGAGGVRISAIRTFLIDNRYDCSADKVNVLWENYEGGIDTYTFINPREIKSVNRQVMRLNGYSNSINNVFENLSQVVSSTVESTYRLTTLGLTDEVYKALSNMIGTENAYVELGDGSLWGIVLDNTSVEVKRRKYETSLLRFDLQFKSIPNLDLINRGSVLIEDDLMPNPMVFNGIIGAEFDSQYTSNTIVVTGINVTVPVSVTGGQYRVNNGVWASQPSILNNGDELTLRVNTGTGSLTNYTVVVTVGEGTGTWTVQTKQILNVPDTISFTGASNTELNTIQTSNLVTITGINVPINISISNGSYSKNGGAYSTSPTTAVNGDTFILRHTSAGVGLSGTTTVFNYGSKTANFTTTTREYDIIPDDFSFTNVTNAPLNSEQLSNIITVNGITDPIGISISSGQYRINGGTWVSTSGTVVQGDTVQLRLFAPANAGQSVSTTLTIGSKSANWNVDTTAPDIVPNPFNFTPDIQGAALNAYVNSNTITVSGINTGSPISISSGASYTQYRINGGAWTSANGTVFNGDTVQLRIQGASTYETTRATLINIGGVTDGWNVTTLNAPSVTLELCSSNNEFEVRIDAQLIHAPNATFTTQSIVVNGEFRYRDDNSQLRSQPFTFTIPSGANTHTEFIYPSYNLHPTNALVAIFGITTSPANGANISTQAGTRKMISYTNYGSCLE